MPSLSSRTAAFTDSVIRRMTRINNTEPGSINLSQGFPDWNPPAAVMDRLAQVAHTGPHQYSTTWGAQNIREAIADKYTPTLGHEIDPDTQICVTCGGTEAMMAAVMTVCDPGDTVIVFSPFYENYGADALLSGARAIYVPLHPPSFTFDPDELERAFATGARAIIVCDPSNPTGRVFSRDELSLIADLATRHDAFVITDEVYEHIIYDDAEHIPVASLPGMAERTICCNSLSKTYSMTGWRLGFLIGPARVIEGARKVHDFLTVGAAAPLQEAAVVALRQGPEYYAWLRGEYTRKREILCAGLEAAGLDHHRPEGTYFVMVDVARLLRSPRLAGMSDLELCTWMIHEIGVAAVPGSSFFHEPVSTWIRLHFARSDGPLVEAGRRLGRLAQYL